MSPNCKTQISLQLVLYYLLNILIENIAQYKRLAKHKYAITQNNSKHYSNITPVFNLNFDISKQSLSKAVKRFCS